MPTFADTLFIAAPPETVWQVLTDPERSTLWRGAAFASDWQPGSPLRVRRRFAEKIYEDHGIVREADPPRRLVLAVLSTISHLPDRPENYATIAMDLRPVDGGTEVTVTHTVPENPAAARTTLDMSGERHIAFYWRSTLPLLKLVAEGGDLPPAIRLAAQAVLRELP